ncbi:hypothetical protein JCM21900_006838 [Sporobolomyces salmonicolor]
MGTFIWHDWARLLALTSACFTIWAAAWGIFFRKYFWSFVGGELGPEGLIPPPQAAFFVKTVVTLPLFQILILINGLLTLALEYPLPQLRGTKLHRSLALRVGFYLFAALPSMFVYQTVDGGVFYLVTSVACLRALRAGESLWSKVEDRPTATAVA